MQKHVTVRLGVAEAPMRGHITLPLAVNVAVFENRGGVTENEINVTLDVAVLVILPPTVREQRILPADEATIAKDNSIGVHVNGDGLRTSAVGVLKRKVLSAKVTAPDIGAVRLARVSRCFGAEIKRQSRLQCVLTLERDEGFSLRELQLL